MSHVMNLSIRPDTRLVDRRTIVFWFLLVMAILFMVEEFARFAL